MKITIQNPTDVHTKKRELIIKAADIILKQQKYNIRIARKLGWIQREIRRLEDVLYGDKTKT